MVMQLLEDKFYTILFFVIGIIIFFVGFMRLRRKRIVENIPTSTVRGLALGLVELIGNARAISKSGKPFIGPVSGIECVYYQFQVERLVIAGKRSHWETIVEGNSEDRPFWFYDQTGTIPVFPKGAEFELSMGFEHVRSASKPLAPYHQAFLGRYHLTRYQNSTLLFREWHIRQEAVVYVLGTAKKSHDFMGNYKNELMRRIEALTKDKDRMAEVDVNKDGQISEQEWDRAVERIEKELLEESLASSQSQEGHDIIIAQGDEEKVFMISNSNQKELLGQLAFEVQAGIFGGLGLAVYTFWSIVQYLRSRF